MSEVYTCTDVRKLTDSGLAALDTADLATLTRDEFESCVDVLSDVDGFTEQHYATLAELAKDVRPLNFKT